MEPPSAFRPNSGLEPSTLSLPVRDGRDEIPVHRVAEGLVEAHAVDVNGDALGGALQRRDLEAVIEQRGLVRIARCAVEIDAGDLCIERLQHVRRTFAGDVGAAEHLGGRRDQVAVDAAAQ